MMDSQLATLYLSEGEQLLQKLDAALLEADQRDALADPAELFRLLHTLKGSSAMMDYVPLVNAAHAFENILSAVKSQGLTPRGAGLRRMIEAGLDFSVYFHGELTRLRDGGQPVENEPLGQKLDALAGELGIAAVPAGTAPKPAPAPESPRQEGERRVLVKLRDCPMPHIRAFIIARAVSPLCAFLATQPEGLKEAAAADASLLAEGFEIRYIPAAGVTCQQIATKLAAQPYVIACTPVETRPLSERSESAAELTQSVTVAQETVNRLINLMDEVATAESAVEAYTGAQGLSSRQLDGLMSTLRHAIAEAGIVAAEIGTRDVGGVFIQMQRTVRGMAKALDKEISLKTLGAEVRVDKSVLEVLADSLIHIVRNAADHGIEPPSVRAAAGKPPAGTITLTAVKKDDALTVTAADDGAGVDRAAVLEKARWQGKLVKPMERYTDADVCRLLLTSGVSTSAEVTRYSGRGVGLDTVMRRIRQAGGSVAMDSEKGRGTTFTLKIPLTLMTVDGVEILTLSGSRVIVPAGAIRHIMPLATAEQGVIYRGEAYAPLTFPGEGSERPAGGYALLLSDDYGLRFLYARAVSMMTPYYVKPMPEYVAAVMGSQYLYAGCVIGADARLRCVLDAAKLISAASAGETPERQNER